MVRLNFSNQTWTITLKTNSNNSTMLKKYTNLQNDWVKSMLSFKKSHFEHEKALLKRHQFQPFYIHKNASDVLLPYWFYGEIINNYLKNTFEIFRKSGSIFWIFWKNLYLAPNNYKIRYIYWYFSRFWADFDQIKFILQFKLHVLSNLTLSF